MKNCPFCAEQIQDEAIKCKYCGEWLNKKTPLTYLNAAKKYIGDKINEYQKNTSKHLFYPEINKPIELNNAKFYPEYFIFKGITYMYKDVYSIIRVHSSSSINAIKMNENFIFKLIVSSLEDKEKLGTFIDLTINGKLFSSNAKKLQTTILCANFLEEKTFQSRLNKYLKETIDAGYFEYAEKAKIFNNGDLLFEDKFIINLIEALNQKMIFYSIKFNSFVRLENNQSPFLFKIKNYENKTGIFASKKYIQFPVVQDKDVFDSILHHLFTNGYIQNPNYGYSPN